MRTETYKRGQVEWALWRSMTAMTIGTPKNPPQVFLTRIKRLIELDRADPRPGREGESAQPFAFFNDAPSGQGADVEYSAFNAVCLGLGLDMLDSGFKQSEIVFLLRHIRPQLQNAYEKVLKSPPHERGRIRPKDRPDAPTFVDRGTELADCRIFAVIRQVKLEETIHLSRTLPEDTPIIVEPTFCRGIEALRDELHRMDASRRKVFVLEIAHLASLVTRFLEKSPETKRGRK